MFDHLSKKEKTILFISLSIPAIVFAGSMISIISGMREYTVYFTVFDVAYMGTGEQTGDTIVLTWGEGKYYFQGDWTGNFELDQTYRVVYIRPLDSPRDDRHLIILEYEQT